MQDSPQFSIREKSKSEHSDGKISAKTLFHQSDNHYEIKSTTKQLKYKIQVGMLEKANVLNISKKILLSFGIQTLKLQATIMIIHLNCTHSGFPGNMSSKGFAECECFSVARCNHYDCCSYVPQRSPPPEWLLRRPGLQTPFPWPFSSEV